MNENRGYGKRILQVLFQVVLFGGLLFASSGGLNWTWAWIYLGTYILIIVINAFLLPKDLIEERGGSKKNVKKWDRVIMTLNIFPALGQLVVAGLDCRFGWSALPAGFQGLSLFLMILGNVFFTWAMVANHFFSTAVRIQSERGQQVATGGPYRYLRHPGYAGFIVINLTTPLVLGSLWALIPGFISAVLFIIRTGFEDAALLNELEGYKDYAKKVRFRLIPGVW